MYEPPLHKKESLEAQHALIRSQPLGVLVSKGPDGLEANAIPFLIDASASKLGTLRAHMARANPQWRSLGAADEALVVFQGPDRYISPNWYATKRDTGKVVPTWNYVMVQARGRPRVIEDPEWLRAQIEELTRTHEGRRPAPWAVSDAPADFVAMQVKAIVGVEIEIARIAGKWKASQNRPAADREGVIEGLTAEGEPMALDMAEIVRGEGGKS
ncbi:MAG TPA: FMN-binding negative transcriptional regulator [Roseiarcus sp.]|jgi:transcriptional regulator|nr:FMN-binding negative transcriptional regulator [Roseiarcus sp.]